MLLILDEVLLFPSSDRLRSRRRLTLIMAVSAEEKKEER